MYLTSGSVKMKASMRSREKTTNPWGEDQNFKIKTTVKIGSLFFRFACRKKYIQDIHLYRVYIDLDKWYMACALLWRIVDNFFPYQKFASLRCCSIWHLELEPGRFFSIETRARFHWLVPLVKNLQAQILLCMFLVANEFPLMFRSFILDIRICEVSTKRAIELLKDETSVNRNEAFKLVTWISFFAALTHFYKIQKYMVVMVVCFLVCAVDGYAFNILVWLHSGLYR